MITFFNNPTHRHFSTTNAHTFDRLILGPTKICHASLKNFLAHCQLYHSSLLSLLYVQLFQLTPSVFKKFSVGVCVDAILYLVNATSKFSLDDNNLVRSGMFDGIV
jgi:hypothetical protein